MRRIPNSIATLANECLDALFQPCQVMFNLRAQQCLHAAVGKLRLDLANGSSGIAEEPGHRHAQAGLRPRAFEQYRVVDFNLIEMVALRLEKLPPLVDGGFHNGVVISAERNLRTVRLQEILIDVETRAERFERRFQPLHGIFLFS